MVAGVLGAALATSGPAVGTERALAAPSPAAGQSGSRPPGAAAVPLPGGAVLAPVVDADDTLPTTQGLQQAVGTLLQDKSLGTLNFAVADAATGRLLFGAGEATPATPASTTKLATSVAALALLPADHRITTKVVAGAKPDEIVLVGGGDPTLTALPADQVQVGGLPVDPDSAPASMADLAAQTAAALKAAGTTGVRLGYDTSLYTGQVRHMEKDDYNIAPVTPLMVDEGKYEPRSQIEAPARVPTRPPRRRTPSPPCSRPTASPSRAGPPPRPRPPTPARSARSPRRPWPGWSSGCSPTRTTPSPKPSPGRRRSPRTSRPASRAPRAR